jgi:hypothetical protein
MRMIADPLHSWNLVPFKKRRDVYDIPCVARGEDQRLIDQVDPDLSPEEQSFIRHYLGYADTLLRSAPVEVFAQPEEASPGDTLLPGSVKNGPENNGPENNGPEQPDPEHKDPSDQAA